MAAKEKDLKNLKREDLLEILLEQQREIEMLQDELADVREQLEQRYIDIDEAGNLADAVMKLNRVFEAAQAAADQYVENVRLRTER